MSFRFSDGFGMFDITPVENLFIEEYMLRAPGDYVKVYLYGLRLCYHPDSHADTGAVARALTMEQHKVEEAFSYWEKQGVLRRVADRPPTYEYNNLKALLVRAAAPEDKNLYRYRAFNNGLQALFGAKLLTPKDYQRAAEWVEDLQLSEDSVLLMVRNAIADRGTKVSFAYLDKIATNWAQNGLGTKEAAEAYLRTQGSPYKGAQAVLRAIGQRRAPTMDEESLYRKWTEDWGFSAEAIEEALPELSKIGSPNFAYLDKVLEGAHRQGATQAGQVQEAQRERRDRMAPVRDTMKALGQNGTPTEDLATLYESWLRDGFDAEAVRIAAEQVRRAGGTSFEDTAAMLSRFGKRGLYSGAEIAAYVSELTQERAKVRALRELAGEAGDLAQGDISVYRQMAAIALPENMLEEAMRLSQGKKAPLQYALAILRNWKLEGLTTLEAVAQKQGARAGTQTTGSTAPFVGKRVSAQQYDQREYSEDDWNALAMDLGDL